MVVRTILLIVAVGLALMGCAKNRATGHPAKRAQLAVPAGHAAARPVAPTMLRPSIRGYAQPVRTAPVSSYTLDSGDRLRVTVFGQDNLSRIYPVDSGGFISMPLIGAVGARGLTTFQLEERIAVTLRRKYVKDPKVTVEVAANRPFFILGEVRNAGQFPYVAGMTVQTAIAIAGGFTPRARKSRIRLSTQVNGATHTRNVPLTARIKPGDTIMVQERFF